MTRFRRRAPLLAAALLGLGAAPPAGGAHSPAIIAGPGALTNDPRPVFFFSVPDGTTGGCALDGVDVPGCASPYRPEAPLADGPHVFEILAGGAAVHRSFTVDTVPPALSISAPAASAESVVAVETTHEAGSALACGADDDMLEPCASPWRTRPLVNGRHRLTVQATDPAGNVTATARDVDVAVDPPDTEITSGPDGDTELRTPAFGLRSDRAGARFECRVDDDPWTACGGTFTAPDHGLGEHLLMVRAIDAAGNADPFPAQRRYAVVACTKDVRVGAVHARAACFTRDGTKWVADAPVQINGIAIESLGGQQLVLDEATDSPETQAGTMSLGRVQLRMGSIVLFQGELLNWAIPAGDDVTLAEINLETKSLVNTPEADDEGALDLVGDDDANVKGFPLRGTATLRLEGGTSVLRGAIELPSLFTDAEGNGLTGDVVVRADNDRGVRLDGIAITAPLVMLGRLELHGLALSFANDGSRDGRESCNQISPGLRWEGRADRLVVPTPDRLTLEDVGIGLADGAFDFARASWVPGEPGASIGAGLRVQRITVEVCAGPPLVLDGRVRMTAMPGEDGAPPGLTLPEARLRITGGEAWAVRADAPRAVLDPGREIELTRAYLDYASGGAVGFGGRMSFEQPLEGATPAGPFEGSVSVDAGLEGFIEGRRFNAAFDATGCFAGTLVVGVPLPVPGNACTRVEGVVSSVGLAICGGLQVGPHDLGRIGAGAKWGEPPRFMAGTCDVAPWTVDRAPTGSLASAGAARSVRLPAGRRGMLVAVRGVDAPPQVVLRGPRGEVVRSAASPHAAVRTESALAFANVAERTTYVVLARPAGGRWLVEPVAGGARVARISSAPIGSPPVVSADIAGRSRAKTLRYTARLRAGQRVVFYERGPGVARRLGTGRRGTHSLRFVPARGPGGRRRIEAVVEHGGLPVRRLVVAGFTAPPPRRPARPRAVRLIRERGAVRVRWLAAPRAERYGLRVATDDGRRTLALRDRDGRSARIGGIGADQRVRIRIVGLRDGTPAGPAATALSRASVARRAAR